MHSLNKTQCLKSAYSSTMLQKITHQSHTSQWCISIAVTSQIHDHTPTSHALQHNIICLLCFNKHLFNPLIDSSTCGLNQRMVTRYIEIERIEIVAFTFEVLYILIGNIYIFLHLWNNLLLLYYSNQHIKSWQIGRNLIWKTFIYFIINIILHLTHSDKCLEIYYWAIYIFFLHLWNNLLLLYYSNPLVKLWKIGRNLTWKTFIYFIFSHILTRVFFKMRSILDLRTKIVQDLHQFKKDLSFSE